MYDPLINSSPAHQPLAASYWLHNTQLKKTKSSLVNSQTTDVAIIGGGYTGLLTAYYLATEFNIDCHVLEANQIGFGASARNAGFVLKGSGRMSYAQMAKKWDMEIAKGIFNEFTQAVSRVDELIESKGIDCDRQENGYLKIAHNRQTMQLMQNAADFIEKNFGQSAQFIQPEEFKQCYMNHQQAFGALRLDDGFGVHPVKLLLGYKQLVQKIGVTISEKSCVLDWIEENGFHRLMTSQGELKAKRVICAGNGYTPKKFNQRVDNKYLPILSNVIVTEPISPELLQHAGIHTHQVAMDTRILKYYYRLLPDNRILFGGRGAVWGEDANDPKYGYRLKQALNQCFPVLSTCKVDFNWTGWIAAAFDDMPHVFEQGGVGYSLGYCGAGVSFSAQAAYRLAQSIAGEKIPNLPLYRLPLPKIPLAQLRRWGQWSYYYYGFIKDKFTS